MPSYLITGAARGIGFAFLENLSKVPTNTVIGLVRNKADTEAKIATWNKSNVHVIQGNLEDYDSLERAAEATAKITGGSLDILIANAAFVSSVSALDPFSVLGKEPKKLEAELNKVFTTNVVGNIHLFNLFIPLILKSDIKKVISISSGMADIELAREYNVFENGPYSISKAAMNMATAKFSADHAKHGVLFLSVCPGVVETGHTENASEEDIKKWAAMGGKFQEYAPHFKGPATPEDSVKDVLSVIDRASLANGDGGAFISHLGTKTWL